MSRTPDRRRLALIVIAWSTACTFPHPMERASPPAGSTCPAVAAVSQSVTPSGTAALTPEDPTRLVWYRAVTDRDRELAARWCATVGEPVLLLEPDGSRAAEWRSDRALEVISWNTWIGGGRILELLSREVGVDCSRDGAAADAPPFVLLLQEVWRFSADLPDVGRSAAIPFTIISEREPLSLDIVDTARRCGLALVYVPSARNGPDSGPRPKEDKGNAVLSNLPLTDPMAFDLPLEGGRKVAVATTVTGPAGERLRVVSLHLDVASTLVRTVLSGNQTRVRQGLGLVEGLARAEEDGYRVDATLVGADMNTWASNEGILIRMHHAFPESPPWDGLGTRAGIPTDHMFFRTGAGSGLEIEGYERIARLYGSDHHARRIYVLSRSVSR